MKIIDAFWEERNLGLKTKEVIIEKHDNLNSLEDIESIECQYLVIKIPLFHIDLMLALQNLNYIFIELITTCVHDLREPSLTALQRRLISSISCKKASKKTNKNLEIQIKKGLFSEDRVSVDPFFSEAQSNDRYLGWIEDELTRGATVYDVDLKEKNVGFFLARESKGQTLFALLGGIYPDFQKAGLGLAMNYLEIDLARKLGLKKVKTSYSSNNRGASSIHHQLAYNIENQYYVLVKHY